MRTLKGQDTFWAWKLGATPKHAHHLSVMTLTTAIKVLRQQASHAATIASLNSLKVPGQYTTLQWPEEVLQLSCEPDANQTSLKVPLPLPTSLPACLVPTTSLHARYGLPQVKPYLAKAVVLVMQLGELKQWATSDFQLDRKGRALQHVSWENVLGHIYLFLGFCHKWMGVQQPTLQHFLKPHLILAFVSFHRAKNSAVHTIKHHLQAASKVLSWWTTKPGGHDEGLHKMVKEWLPNLSDQVLKPSCKAQVMHQSAPCLEKSKRHPLLEHQNGFNASHPLSNAWQARSVPQEL